MTSQTAIYALFTLVLIAAFAAGAEKCPRDCKCLSQSKKIRSIECAVKPQDSPENVIYSMLNSKNWLTSITVKAHYQPDAVLWTLERSLLMTFTVLSELSVPASGLISVGQACFVGLPLTIVDLSDNLIKNIVPGTFAEMELLNVLDLSNTSLKYLDGFVFRDLKLGTLNLSSNSLNDFNNHVFNGSEIGELDLSRNDLTEIRLHQLAPLKKSLKKLNLSWNKLTTLNEALFQNFRNLTHLNLNHNKILSISYRMFANGSGIILPNLQSIELRDNQILDLSMDFIEVFNKVQLFDIDENPLSCNCKLKWLGTNYANQICEPNKTCFNETTCITNGKTSLIQEVPASDFHCKPAEIKKIKLEADKLICIVQGDPLPEVWWSEPSGRKIESETSRTTKEVISTVHLNLHSMIGAYSCMAKGYDGNEVLEHSPPFGVCPSRHQYFDKGILIISVVATFVGCVLCATMIILWKKCTAKSPKRGKASRFNGVSYHSRR